MLRKLAEFKSNDQKLVGVSQRQLSHLCAQMDQRVIHSWQQLKAVELQQSVQLLFPCSVSIGRRVFFFFNISYLH